MIVAYVILGLCALVGTVLIARWFVSADPKQVMKGLKWVAIIGVVGILLAILLAGRLGLAFFLLPALLPFLARLRHAFQRAKTMRGPSRGQTSEVTTRFFRMSLDHDTGEMDGVVLEGAHQGARLSDLPPDALFELWRWSRAEDEQSASVLEAFLDRTQGEDWRDAAGGGDEDQAGRAHGQTPMTRDEAYEVLGLEPGATEEEIRAAHRRLMRQAHPDQGGSNYLAAKVNQAKDLLLSG